MVCWKVKRKGVAILSKPPAKTTIAAAIRMLEGPIALLPCVSLNFTGNVMTAMKVVADSIRSWQQQEMPL